LEIKAKYLIICTLVMLLVVINVTNLEKSIGLRMFQLTENVVSFHSIGFNITLGTENGDYSLTFASDNSYHILKSVYNRDINKYLLTSFYDFPLFENSTSTLYSSSPSNFHK
jgi:hypothetical protein